jgi:hypothetical protein
LGCISDWLNLFRGLGLCGFVVVIKVNSLALVFVESSGRGEGPHTLVLGCSGRTRILERRRLLLAHRAISLRSQRAQVLSLLVHFVEQDLLVIAVTSLNSVELGIALVRYRSVISVVIDSSTSAGHSLRFFTILFRLDGSSIVNNLRVITGFTLRLNHSCRIGWFHRISCPLRSSWLTVKRAFLLLI